MCTRLELAGTDNDRAIRPSALYEVKVDTDGDAVADLAYRVQFAVLQSHVGVGFRHRLDDGRWLVLRHREVVSSCRSDHRSLLI